MNGKSFSTGIIRVVQKKPDLFDGILVGLFFCIALAYAGPVGFVMDKLNGRAYAGLVPKFALLCVIAFTPAQLLFEIRNRIRFGKSNESFRFSMLTRAQLHYSLGVLATCAVLLPVFMLSHSM